MPTRSRGKRSEQALLAFPHALCRYSASQTSLSDSPVLLLSTLTARRSEPTSIFNGSGLLCSVAYRSNLRNHLRPSKTPRNTSDSPPTSRTSSPAPSSLLPFTSLNFRLLSLPSTAGGLATALQGSSVLAQTFTNRPECVRGVGSEFGWRCWR
jgi:hypothetical protein